MEIEFPQQLLIIIIIIIPWVFFTPDLAGGLSMESKSPSFFSIFWPISYSRLHSLDSSSDFHLFHHISNPSGTIPTSFTVTCIFFFVLFCSLSNYLVLQSICLSFRFLLFSLCGPLERQNLLDDKFSFCWWIAQGLVFWPRLINLFVS